MDQKQEKPKQKIFHGLTTNNSLANIAAIARYDFNLDLKEPKQTNTGMYLKRHLPRFAPETPIRTLFKAQLSASP
jgi:hypothetical protein